MEKTLQFLLPIVVGALSAVLPTSDSAPGTAQGSADEVLWQYEEVRIDRLPEVVRRVPPVRPDAARRAGVSGMVLVQALVGRDGIVKQTQILKSIPMLDAAAERCVRRWKFRPAMVRGRPVAIWVAVPVRFAPGDAATPDDSAVPPPPESGREPHGEVRPFESDRLSGYYLVEGESGVAIRISRVEGETYRVERPGEWIGVGFFDGSRYWGVFRCPSGSGDAKAACGHGTHSAELMADGSLRVRTELRSPRRSSIESRWVRAPELVDPPIRRAR